MKHKKLIVLLLSALLTVVFVAHMPYLILYGLILALGHSTKEYEIGDVLYQKATRDDEEHYIVCGLSEQGKTKDIVYVPDEIDGIPVTRISDISFSWGPPRVIFSGGELEKIYFPWSINSSIAEVDENLINIFSPKIKYVFSTNIDTIATRYMEYTTIIPRLKYENNNSPSAYLLPANVAYFFNYEENPNEGYFFIDLLEESGKLTKPPYDPKREGYTFAGWYIDAECTKEWNFETDEVIINYDEEGNRIYEEFCLYAKWTE